MDYDKKFADMIAFMEFSIDKDDDGYMLVDCQHVNLGDIESERFSNASQIINRLDTYIGDYMLDDEEWGQYETCEEALAVKDHPLHEFFDLIVNHINEVNLDKAMAC